MERPAAREWTPGLSRGARSGCRSPSLCCCLSHSPSSLSLFLLPLLLAGCGGGKKIFSTPYEPAAAPGPFSADAPTSLAMKLAARHPEWKTFQSQFEVNIETVSGGHQRFDANLLVQFPDRARLRGSRSPIGNLFELIASGSRYSIYFNRDGVLFTGNRGDLEPKAGLLKMMNPEDILRALLAERDLAARLQKPGAWRVEDCGDALLVKTGKPDGSWQVWVARKSDGLIEETLLGRKPGRADVRVRYWAYDFFDGEPLPSQLEIHLADPKVTIEIEVDRYRVNPPLSAAVFAPPPVARDKTYPLRDLRMEPMEE